MQIVSQSLRKGAVALFALLLLGLVAGSAVAAPYAAMVVDARNGKVLHSRNADTRLHPASLTKMMTLYVVFEAVENGEISLDTQVRISKKAAAEPPSKLGLRAGQRIKLRYLIRAAAVKSANDAATALAEAIEGSEAAFARRMNRTARAMGMNNTTFKNAHGLTEAGHLSTARDMTTLGRHVLYDYPEYYNLFSRRTTHAGLRTVSNTNRRLLGSYKGADGIKTGYTRAAGFNLVASAERGRERVIATVFGGRSSAWRNARVAELLDMGFKRAPTRVALNRPGKPSYGGYEAGPRSKTIRVNVAVAKSLRPRARPGATPPPELLLAMQDEIEEAVSAVQPVPQGALAEADVAAPPPRPAELAAVAPEVAAAPVPPAAAPRPRPQQGPVVVTRMSSSGGRHWGINVGRFTTRHKAEQVLLATALREIGILDEALRKVARSPQGFEANFVGMTRQEALRACARLSAQGADCAPFGPKS